MQTIIILGEDFSNKLGKSGSVILILFYFFKIFSLKKGAGREPKRRQQ